MPDLVKMLRDLADAYERESKGEESKALQDRIDKLEADLKKEAPTPREVDEATEEITDEELELIRAHRKNRAAPPAPAPAADPPPDPPTAKTRPGRKKGQAYQWTVDGKGKVQRTDIAHIYSGEDEPDQVEILEEEADAA